MKNVTEALKKNGMEAYLLPNAAAACEKIRELVPEGAVVGAGGSVTLAQTGVMDLLKSGYYRFLDRSVPGLTPEQVREIYLKTFDADAYFCSANAITEAGELVNVDGNGNRVAALTFGPRRVIVVAGINKIVPDVEAGLRRVKTVAAPQNTRRLHCQTYCNKTGVCLGAEGGFTAGCASPQRICSHYVVTGFQRNRGRIHVLLVEEELGY